MALPAHAQRPVCRTVPAGSARCNAHVVTRAHSTVPLATSSYLYGYSSTDLQAAYQLPSSGGGSGSGPTVAIVDAYDNPNAASDLAAYRSQFGLGTCDSASGCFSKVNQNGGQAYPSGNTGWGAEIDLDIEMVSAACPSCKILLVEANSNSFADLMTAVDYAAGHADYVSNSYGGNEFSSETAYDSHFDHPGVGITVSAGDSGYGVEYPAASPYVTAVGGTSLTHTSNGWSQTAWSGTGSGCSALEPQPSWQIGLGSCTHRTVADVSADADPNTGVAVYDSYGSSGGANWYVYGGTSVASPLIAGTWALTGSLASGTTAPQVPYLNQSGWTDITSGTNTHHCRDGYLCQAGQGYDGPTGLGTPIGASGFGGSSGGSGGGGTTGSPSASFTDSCSGLTCNFTDTSSDVSGVNITGWSWSFGDGSSTSASQNPSHTYGASGTYTVTLTVTDDSGATDTTTQQVAVGPTASFTDSCSGLACSFTDTSTDASGGTVTGWSWSFGDPTSPTNTSTSQDPSHTYGASGTYPVTLTVTDSNGATATTSSSVTVSATQSTMTVGVTAGAVSTKGHNNSQVPITVNATDSSGGGIAGASVQLDVYQGSICSGSPAASGSATTDSTGSASFNFHTKSSGSWCAEATVSASGYSTKTGQTTFSTP